LEPFRCNAKDSETEKEGIEISTRLSTE
jgi:hypothetical protein